MGFKLIYLPLAKQDIDEIDDYLSHFYPGTAGRFFAALEKSFNQLSETPDIGTPYRDYRRLVVQQYLVFYKVDHESQVVRVFRILRGTFDINKHLDSDNPWQAKT